MLGKGTSMTQPDDNAQVRDSTDVTVPPSEVDAPVDPPASSDPDELTDDGSMGGVGGENAGGAG